MALKIFADLPQGVFPDAYHRIIAAHFHEKDTVQVNIYTYVSEAARLAEKTPINAVFLRVAYPETMGESLLGTLYNSLKLLPEYSEAVDC